MKKTYEKPKNTWGSHSPKISKPYCEKQTEIIGFCYQQKE